MSQFMFVYHGGTPPETEEARAKSMAEWRDWMSANDKAIVEPGAPLGKSWTVNGGGASEGGGANPAAGYTIVEARDIDDACRIAESCPMIGDGGSVEVAEIHAM